MSVLNLLISISDRSDLPLFLDVNMKNHLEINHIALGEGTGKNHMSEVLGLNNSDKAVIFSITTDELWLKLKNDLEENYGIGGPGRGAAFIVPLSSFGGTKEFAYYTDGIDYKKDEVQTMKDTKVELIVIISNQGHNNEVMNAAKAAGASGGTLIHAAGTGVKKAEQFFGISLATEKDITFIVCKSSLRKAIMESVMKEAGLNTPAKSIAFSLPVSDTVGIKHLSD